MVRYHVANLNNLNIVVPGSDDDGPTRARYMQQMKARAARLGVSVEDFIKVKSEDDEDTFFNPFRTSPRGKHMNKILESWKEDNLGMTFEEYFELMTMHTEMGVDDDRES